MSETSDDTKNVSFRWDVENVEDFDEAILIARLNDDDIDKSMSRSDVLRYLATQFTEEYLEGNVILRAATAAN